MGGVVQLNQVYIPMGMELVGDFGNGVMAPKPLPRGVVAPITDYPVNNFYNPKQPVSNEPVLLNTTKPQATATGEPFPGTVAWNNFQQPGTKFDTIPVLHSTTPVLHSHKIDSKLADLFPDDVLALIEEDCPAQGIPLPCSCPDPLPVVLAPNKCGESSPPPIFTEILEQETATEKDECGNTIETPAPEFPEDIPDETPTGGGGSGGNPPTFTSIPVIVAQVGIPYTYNITVDDLDPGILVITSGSLPAWLTLVDNTDRTATLTGTPTETGTVSIALVVTDGDGNTANQQFDIDIVSCIGCSHFATGGPVSWAFSVNDITNAACEDCATWNGIFTVLWEFGFNDGPGGVDVCSWGLDPNGPEITTCGAGLGWILVYSHQAGTLRLTAPDSITYYEADVTEYIGGTFTTPLELIRISNGTACNTPSSITITPSVETNC